MQRDRAAAGMGLVLATATRVETTGCSCLPATAGLGTRVPSFPLRSSLRLPYPPGPSVGGNNPSGPALLSVDSGR